MTDLTFGPFTLESATSRLVRDGVEVRLRPQAFQALKVLLDHRGRSVSYEQMIAEAWKGTFVSRHTVDVTVGEVRKTPRASTATWITHRPKVGYCLEVPTSDALVRKGWHFWDRRTRQGFERAPRLLPAGGRGMSVRLPRVRRAVGLLPDAGHLRRPRAARDVQGIPRRARTGGGARRTDAATALQPCARPAHVRAAISRGRGRVPADAARTSRRSRPPTYALAMLYATLGRFDEAFEVIARGLEADPLFPLLPSCRPSCSSGVAITRRRSSSERRWSSCIHTCRSVVRSMRRRWNSPGGSSEALEQYKLASLMSPDLTWLRGLEGTCLASMGRTTEAWAILEELEHIRRTEYVDAYYMAILRAALGQRDQAFAELERAYEESSARLWDVPCRSRNSTTSAAIAATNRSASSCRSRPRLSRERPRRIMHPPPGRLISIGSHTLHLHCAGDGSPTVVFDAALGASSLSWGLVHPQVARLTARVRVRPGRIRLERGRTDAADRRTHRRRTASTPAARWRAAAVRPRRTLVRRARDATVRRPPSRRDRRPHPDRAGDPGGLGATGG